MNAASLEFSFLVATPTASVGAICSALGSPKCRREQVAESPRDTPLLRSKSCARITAVTLIGQTAYRQRVSTHTELST